MKNWILIVMFALFSLFAMGCLGSDDSTTDDQSIEEPATSTTTSEVGLSCAGRCTQEYNSCITGDPLDDCLCRNALVACRRACGFPGVMTKCYL